MPPSSSSPATPKAASRGETADHLLFIDEMQDQQRSHIESIFIPMRAARNATAVYLGTARSQHDALWPVSRQRHHPRASLATRHSPLRLATARISTPHGMEPVHDDRLISAALIAEADRLIQLGKLNPGQAKSAIIRPSDPLDFSWSRGDAISNFLGW